MSAIFVKGFEFETSEEAIKEHFGTAGEIKELYFQSKNSAVITYVKESAATQAVDDFQKTTIEGQSRKMFVKLDDPDRIPWDGKESEGKGAGKSSGKAPRGRTIFVNGFDFDTDDAALTKHFGELGEIEDYHFQSKGSAVITYADEAVAQKALAELDGSTMDGQSRYVAVKLNDADRPSKGKGKGKGEGKSKGKGEGKSKGKGEGKGKGAGKSKGKGEGKSKGKGKGDGKGKGGGKSSAGRVIFVSGFDFETDEYALTTHFGKMGAIETHHFQGKGSAVITFVKAAAAQRAVSELDSSTMRGQSRYVDVKMDDPDRRKGKGKGKGKW